MKRRFLLVLIVAVTILCPVIAIDGFYTENGISWDLRVIGGCGYLVLPMVGTPA